MTIEELRLVIELMVKNKLDVLEFDGVKLVKTRYEHDDFGVVSSDKTVEQLEDELLFHSVG